MMPLRIGIVGFGRIGAEHAAWIGASEQLRVGSVFDPTPARRAIAASRGLATSESMDALIKDDTIDAVLIATPTSMHFENAMRAVEAGKHVMVEKPVTLDAASAAVLKEAAEKSGVTLSVFHCRRWDLDYLTVKDLLGAGTLGCVFNIESRLGQWASCVGQAAPEFRPGWRNEAAYGGGGLYDWGSHFVDQLWQLMLPAKPIRVFAQLRANVWSTDCDDFARVLIDFDNGATGLCEINTTTTRPLARWHLDGTNGSASSPYSLAFDTREWARLTRTEIDGHSSEIAASDTRVSETTLWERFATAARNGEEPPITIDSVITTMRLLDAARESSRRGAVITLRPCYDLAPTHQRTETMAKTYSSAPEMTIDAKKKYTATFETNRGNIVVDLFADRAPVTVNNFVTLAKDGFYDGLIFHRVIADFMVQGGDPKGTGTGGPGYKWNDEKSALGIKHEVGSLAMANAGPNTNGSQFYITHIATDWLNGKHAVFGKVKSGQDIVDAIKQSDTIKKLTITEG